HDRTRTHRGGLRASRWERSRSSGTTSCSPRRGPAPMIHYQALAAATWLVSAQPAEEPKGTVGTAAPASSGTTEIEGTDQFATSADPSAEETDALELQIAAGGIFNTGNSRSLAATVASDFRVRRSIHQFGA